MEKKLFLKNGLAALGLAAISPLANACKKVTNATNSSDTFYNQKKKTHGAWYNRTREKYSWLKSAAIMKQTGSGVSTHLTSVSTNRNISFRSGLCMC